MTSEYRAQSR